MRIPQNLEELLIQGLRLSLDLFHNLSLSGAVLRASVVEPADHEVGVDFRSQDDIT